MITVVVNQIDTIEFEISSLSGCLFWQGGAFIIAGTSQDVFADAKSGALSEIKA